MMVAEDGGMDDSNMSGEERTMTEDFEFPDLKFIKSSRMTKRWLLFSFKIRVPPSSPFYPPHTWEETSRR